MAHTIDGTFRLFVVKTQDASEPTCDTERWTEQIPYPGMKEVLLARDFIRLEFVVDTTKVTVTAEDYAPDSDEARFWEDWESERSLRDAESGAAYERWLHGQAVMSENPEEARREAEALADFEYRLHHMALPTTPADDENGIPF